MATLPKIIYDGTKVGTVMYNEQEVLNIVEQLPNDGIRYIYHKHQGSRNQNGGCYTIQKQETVSVSHVWTLGEQIGGGNHIGSQAEGEDDSTYSYRVYKITDQHGHTAQVEYVWHSSSGRKMCGFWRMSGMGNYADNASEGTVEGWTGTAGEYGTNETGPWNGARTYTTNKTTKQTYYDLGCGFDQN